MPHHYGNLCAIMGSHSVTYHAAEVTFPPLPQPIKTSLYSVSIFLSCISSLAKLRCQILQKCKLQMLYRELELKFYW